ncbi:coiled-coil domain-containing protein 191 isoform X1 [Peromyscus californicus insignis]|uniref:coiled-coil domain-containing protein 191 isoform X1 n=1 Tax=Peromyscus californicus insignis TaxID=564181 RepID=UPI0022A70371|nr:coiled-coil domain-containing protein 191 isoform X1 [Peromyscus californicus insignis]
MRAACAMPPGRSSSGMSDPCLTGRWWNHNSQHHPKAAWEEEQLSLLWPKSRPEPEKMLLASQERSSKKRMELSRWKRISRKLNPKSAFDPDNVGHWIKRVEKASEFAISNTYSARNADLPGRLWRHAVDLGTCEQTEYHDDVYEEAQELVNDWLDNRLQQELASDGEGEGAVPSSPPGPGAHGHLKYDRFDDLCGYLEEEEENATTQKFIEHLLHKEVVDAAMVEELGRKENQGKRQQKDPRLTMEMRHKQVKENRLRREKQVEFQRKENALKKAAFLEAQCLVQEEKRRKALLARKEKEGIQREMVKLRREILERRRTVEEAWKTEKKRQEDSQRNPEEKMVESAHIHLSEEKVAKERKRKLREILIRTFKENHQCQKRYFSAWHKLILDHRIKLGKAGTLSDWKLQLKVLRAWRDYTRSQKMERETQALKNDLREENRKQELATEYNRNQVLRYCFSEWQRWHGSEVRKRELALAKEQTRRKMDELLKAASLGKLRSNGSSGIRLLAETTATADPPLESGKVTIMPTSWEKPPMRSSGCVLSHSPERTTKGNFQGPLPDVSGSTPGTKHSKTPDAETSEQPGSHEKPGTTSQGAEPVCVRHFHHRHVYQQQLIERQKKKLEEQQKTIQKLKENQRLAEARWAAERAAAVTEAQSHLLSNPRGAEEPQGSCQRPLDSSVLSSRCEDSRTESRNSLSASKRNPTAPHPLLKAMEERAIQRAERRRILAERKKKQEEDKLAQLKAQEEERQKKDAEEKEAQLERKREEKRLKKMKELEKQKRIKRNQELEAVAKDHYEKVLLRKRGLEPWKRLRMQSKQNIEVAEEHYSLALQRKCLISWFQYSQETLATRTAQADQLYSQLLCRRIIRGWLQYVNDLEKEVRKLYVHVLQKKVFRAWFSMVRDLKIESQGKLETAAEHCDRKILSVALRTWKAFVKFTKEERVKEERREQLRRKVADILPDFQILTPL